MEMNLKKNIYSLTYLSIYKNILIIYKNIYNIYYM